MSILDRLWQNLNLAELVRSHRQDKPKNIIERLDEVMAVSGEATGFAMAHDCLAALLALDKEGLGELLQVLHEKYNINIEKLTQSAEAYQIAPGAQNYQNLLTATKSARHELLRRLNGAPGGTQDLVKLRAKLLALPNYRKDYPEIDIDFTEAFISWFNRGFLELRPITWETPAHILEKIISYESVHEIKSWSDLRRRIDQHDRRCFAYFHPAMPSEPLIFVQVALTKGMPGSMGPLLSELSENSEDAALSNLDAYEADTACFYSISNCQVGLRGISFGNFLIKQVVYDLKAEFKNIKSFCTLSPLPGFRKWLEAQSYSIDETEDELLLNAAAQYIYAEKSEDGLPLDAVARFHLGNGAIAHRLCLKADLSDVGLARSYGVMINYLYDDDMVVSNHEKYARSGEIAASAQILTHQSNFKPQMPHIEETA